MLRLVSRAQQCEVTKTDTGEIDVLTFYLYALLISFFVAVFLTPRIL